MNETEYEIVREVERLTHLHNADLVITQCHKENLFEFISIMFFGKYYHKCWVIPYYWKTHSSETKQKSYSYSVMTLFFFYFTLLLT